MWRFKRYLTTLINLVTRPTARVERPEYPVSSPSSPSTPAPDPVSPGICTDDSMADSEGYPPDLFVDDIKKYECAICLGVLRKTVRCGNPIHPHRFCMDCLDEWHAFCLGGDKGNERANHCPTCGLQNAFYIDTGTDERILAMQVKCPKSGCNWSGKLSEYLDKHTRLRSCSTAGSKRGHEGDPPPDKPATKKPKKL